MRKFGIKYSQLHPQPSSPRSLQVPLPRTSGRPVLDKWYAEDLPGRHPDPAIHRVNGSCEEAA